MSNKLVVKNNSRQNGSDSSNPYENSIPFIVYYCTILSRLAYFTSNCFLSSYLQIMNLKVGEGNTKTLNEVAVEAFKSNMESINNIPIGITNKKPSDKVSGLYISDISSKINDITKTIYDKPETCIDFYKQGLKAKEGVNGNVAYISISTSNYAGTYILYDTTKPTCMFVIFRGTYSAKSAGSYTKPNSLVASVFEEINDNNTKINRGVLKGIQKILNDVYHTICGSMVYLYNKYAVDRDKKIDVYTTGHSLGGGLCTLFARKWADTARQEIIKDHYPSIFDKFEKKVYCISVASPRVFDKNAAQSFCEKSTSNTKTIYYYRLAVPSDPVTGLSKGDYEHPCSHDDNKRKEVNIACFTARKKAGLGSIDYTTNIGCQDVRPGRLSTISNPLSHTEYLYINFVTAVPVSEFFSSAMPSKVKTKNAEIHRNEKGDTMCRIIVGSYKKDGKPKPFEFKDIFYDLVPIRVMEEIKYEKKGMFGKAKGYTETWNEDAKMNEKLFDIINTKLKIMQLDDLNPVQANKENEISNDILTKNIDVNKVTVQNGGTKCTYPRKTKKTRKMKKTRKTKKTRKMKKTRKTKK